MVIAISSGAKTKKESGDVEITECDWKDVYREWHHQLAAMRLVLQERIRDRPSPSALAW
jgi:hypothetical protein